MWLVQFMYRLRMVPEGTYIVELVETRKQMTTLLETELACTSTLHWVFKVRKKGRVTASNEKTNI